MDRTAKLWHLEYTFPIRIFAGHEKDVDVIKWHPNCNYFATGSVDKSVRMWSHADAKMVSGLTELLQQKCIMHCGPLIWAIVSYVPNQRMFKISRFSPLF
jgi:WD40 repeat protein